MYIQCVFMQEGVEVLREGRDEARAVETDSLDCSKEESNRTVPLRIPETNKLTIYS